MTITIPHQFKPRSYQIDLLKSRARFKGAIWHRRAGKSKTVLNQQIIRTQLTKGVYYYFLPTYKQAKQVVWDSLVSEHVPQEIIEKKNETELAIYFKNGSILRFAGCEDVDKHRGINPIDVVFDEYSEMDESIWTAIIQPVLRENHGTATFIFTPKGKNHAWKLIQMTRDNPEWYWSIQTVDDTKAIDEKELKEAREQSPEALYRQEYLCSFEEGAGQFFRRILDALYKPTAWTIEGYSFQVGVDLAKYQDWTVLAPFNINTFQVGPLERFNQVDWAVQEARIEAFVRKHNNARARVDSTGVGDPVVENLSRRGITVEPYRFTETSRRQLLDNLAILLEQGKIRIPDDDGLISELEAFRFELSSGGKITVRAPEGIHDDRVMALALSVWGAHEPVDIHIEEYDFKPASY